MLFHDTSFLRAHAFTPLGEKVVNAVTHDGGLVISTAFDIATATTDSEKCSRNIGFCQVSQPWLIKNEVY
ncbi:MAG: hypothetical protein WAU31_02985 [Candidatus Moraniibacteriota bacterium]